MSRPAPNFRTALSVTAALLLSLLSACSRPAAPETASPAAAPSTATATSTARLGDLSTFHRIASDVAALVKQTNFAAAKSRIKDLEVAWDAAEAGLKPRAANDWHTLDKAIDAALTALRADTPKQSDCASTLTALLNTFEQLEATPAK